MRKAVAIATRGRRGIPLHWNERCQNKHYNNRVDDRTLARRICNSMARAKRKHQLCSFKGDWEDFTPVIIKKRILIDKEKKVRKSVTIATKSRRGIRLNWNERYQGKREIDKGIFTVTRRLLNKHERREAKYIIRAFRGLDWDELLFPVKTRETRDSDNW